MSLFAEGGCLVHELSRLVTLLNTSMVASEETTYAGTGNQTLRFALRVRYDGVTSAVGVGQNTLMPSLLVEP